jgi:hypothetical protein
MSRSERVKGARGELEVEKLIRAAGWPLAHRNFGSGSAGGGDIADGPRGVAWEIKRTNRLRLRDAWRQVAADADRAGRLPVLATRWDATPLVPARWLAVLPLDELLVLLRGAGR